MTYDTILKAAMEQSAIDLNCAAEDFCSGENKTVLSAPHDNARRYLQLPFFCQLVSYGSNVVASASAEFLPTVRAYTERYGAVRCFETPAILRLNRELLQYDHTVCFMAAYYLPVPDDLRPLGYDTGTYELRVMEKDDFAPYYSPAFGNAICAEHSERDVLAVGAFDGDRLIGLAGASADCDAMWQIGVDVLPDYRRQGVAAAVTSRLACEIMARDKIPFYCAAWSNVRSARNALRCGFRPAWVELTAKSVDFVEKLM